MLRLDNSSKQQLSFWESVLPPELFQTNEELTQADKVLLGRPAAGIITTYDLLKENPTDTALLKSANRRLMLG